MLQKINCFGKKGCVKQVPVPHFEQVVSKMQELPSTSLLDNLERQGEKEGVRERQGERGRERRGEGNREKNWERKRKRKEGRSVFCLRKANKQNIKETHNPPNIREDGK